MAAEAPAQPTREAVAAPAHGSGGLPQLRYEYWPGQIVWLLIIFAVLYAILSKVFLPRVGRTMEARDERIAGDMAEARRLRDQAEVEARAAEAEMAEARARAQKTATDAKARAAADAAQRQGVLEAELNEKLSAAEARIRTSRDEAMSHVRTIAGETAAAIAGKLTGQAASGAEVEAALSGLAPAATR